MEKYFITDPNNDDYADAIYEALTNPNARRGNGWVSFKDNNGKNRYVWFDPKTDFSKLKNNDGSYNSGYWRSRIFLGTPNGNDTQTLLKSLNAWNNMKALYEPFMNRDEYISLEDALDKELGVRYYENANTGQLALLGKNTPESSGWNLANKFGNYGPEILKDNPTKNIPDQYLHGNNSVIAHLGNNQEIIRLKPTPLPGDLYREQKRKEEVQDPQQGMAYGGYRGYRRYDDGGMMPPDQGMGGGSQVDQVLAMLSQLPPDQLQQVVQALMQMAQGGGMPQEDPSMGGGMPPEGMMAYGGYNRYANGGNIQRTREQRLNYAFGGLINKYRK